MKYRIATGLLPAALIAAAVWFMASGQKAAEPAASPLPIARTASAFAVSGRASDLAPNQKQTPVPGAAGFKVKDVPAAEPRSGPIKAGGTEGRPATLTPVPMPATSLSFDGLTNFDNIAAYNLVILPPDMIGDVGPDHYVQAVNSLFRVYDKSGTPLTAPIKLSQLFEPLGTPCAARNDGLPTVLYDPLADRWLISQYCYNVPPFRQMIAVSTTGDPTGSYFVYEFVMPNVKINDFSKFGVWHDAYYMSTEEFLGSDYAGAGLFAFDRAKLLAGRPDAGYIYFNRPSDSVERRRNFLPSDLDGLRPPPAGAPNTFVSYTADEYGDPQDAIRLFDFHADFVNTSNSTFTERSESPVAVAAFDPTSVSGRTDIAQPAPGDFLDANSDRVNYRVAYRNFGGRESLVFNQTVRLAQSPYRAGVRLYEFQRTGAGPFGVTEQSTIGDATSSRWIGSAAQDHQGNLAVGYNFVNDGKEPSVLYSGRLAGEPAGSFRQEGKLVIGTGVQKAFGWRWGDYSGMSVDPSDDCTFWLTSEYYTQESEDFSEFTWLTRIGRFKFDECTAAPRAVISGTVTNAADGQPINGAQLTVGAYTRRTPETGIYGGLAVVPGTYSMTASAPGFRSQTVMLTAADGENLVRNFALQPVAVIQNASVQVTSESCGTNSAPEPGETVTLNVALSNTGLLNTQSLTAVLVPNGGVTNTGPPQNYGALAAGGPAVSRPFTFTVASTVACGGELLLNFQLNDGPNDLGVVTVVLRAGVVRTALGQNFDRVSGPALPQRWSSSATGAQNSWKASRSRSVSGAKSLFSPDPNQIGLNELTSPAFQINTAGAEVSFQNWYELETTFLRNRLYDGSVMEIKIGDADWQDIIAAGGLFLSGGYDGVIDSCCQNPLGGRSGWSGRSGVNSVSEFITTRAKLPPSAAGNRIQLRWRVGTDVGTFREGQYIDDLLVTDGFVCGCSN